MYYFGRSLFIFMIELFSVSSKWMNMRKESISKLTKSDCQVNKFVLAFHKHYTLSN